MVAGFVRWTVGIRATPDYVTTVKRVATITTQATASSSAVSYIALGIRSTWIVHKANAGTVTIVASFARVTF